MSNITLKPYMRVRNRQGNIFTLFEDTTLLGKSSFPFTGDGISYTKNGYVHSEQYPNPRDIVEIVPLTKADMKEGMKFVCRNGEAFFWNEVKSPTCDGNSFVWTEEFADGLLYRNPNGYRNASQWDIMEVYSLGECIWKRYEEEKTPQQLAIEQAEEEMKQAKAILEKAEANLKQAKTI